MSGRAEMVKLAPDEMTNQKVDVARGKQQQSRESQCLDGHSCRKQFSTRQILDGKLPEPGGGSSVEQSDNED